MIGAEAGSSSTGILLGLPRPFRGGITSIKKNSSLESESYDTVHNSDDLYPLDSFKME